MKSGINNQKVNLANKTLKALNCVFRLALPLAFLSPVFIACEKDPIETNIEPNVNITLPADEGEVGLVIDVRDIFRKGYIAETAEVTFSSEYAAFNQVVEIDPVLNIAIVRIHNKDLTQLQKDAFSHGVFTNILIWDQHHSILADYHDEAVLDDSGEPLHLQTNLPFKVPPVLLKEDIPYYIQPEDISGGGNFTEGSVLVSLTSVLYEFRLPHPDTFNYKYFFEHASDSSYYILRANNPAQVPTYYFFTDPGSANPDLIRVSDQPVSNPLEFVVDQQPGGWVRLREAGTDKYLTITEGTSSSTNHDKALRMQQGTEDRFRFITPRITWTASDRGTIYQPPVMPPAQIDFAYGSTIKNCSAGSITETVGLIKSRTSTRSVETTESLQLYASLQSSLGVKVGAEVGSKVAGIGQVKANVEVNVNYQFTTSATRSSELKLTGQQEETSEVSRTRAIEILPFTGTQVYDAVRTVRNARTPFTQVIRITAMYIGGELLSGDELRTQMMMNLVDGVVVETGPYYVDVSLRGHIGIDQMFEAETGAEEIPNACD